MRITKVIDPHKFEISEGLYENCVFTLDSARDDDRINAILSGSTPLLKFKHCTIIYKGGPVNLILAWKNQTIPMQFGGGQVVNTAFNQSTLNFENCIFVFSIPNAPPPSGEQITRTLLAQNGPTLVLPGS